MDFLRFEEKYNWPYIVKVTTNSNSPQWLFHRVTYYLWKRMVKAVITKPDKRWFARSVVICPHNKFYAMAHGHEYTEVWSPHILRRCAPGKLNHFESLNWIPPNWDLCTQKELRITKSVSVYITFVKPFQFWGAILLNLSPSKVSCAFIHTAYFTYTNLPSYCFHF